MQIPLDYYRILGVPIQATPEQLQQAYSDRAQQLPRSHYSNSAIAARKQLLEAAYTLLSDPEQRQAYDEKFLAKTYALEPQAHPQAGASGEGTIDPRSPKTSGIEIQDHQLAGALLLLQELGEYELVLQLGSPYLRNGILDLKHHRLGSVLSEADIVLTVALCDLELGREQWQQGQYEKAAQFLQAGLELLLREGLFSDIQSEIRADLFKLRPYRILELLALPEDAQSERRQGFSLLQEMLDERGGIDGTGNDQSGLNVHEFLRFIQQLRSYLSVSEQQELFENEAHRPSPVATYLAIYALIAQGYVQRQPALIRQTKAMLLRFSTHQEVYLEQAVCALLLGQPAAANQLLELSHEYETLAFIREHSADSPDLIPGLYLYTERWLQDEVFPYFRNLADQQVHLKAYFADPQVQDYLETLVAEPALATSGETTGFARVEPLGSPAGQTALHVPPDRNDSLPGSGFSHQNVDQVVTPTLRQPTVQPPEPQALPLRPQDLSFAQRLMQQSVATPDSPRTSSQSRRPARRDRPSSPLPEQKLTSPLRGKVANPPRVRKPAHRPSLRLEKQRRQVKTLGLIALGLLAIGAVTATIVYALRELQSPSPGAQEQPLVELERPPLPIPAPRRPPAQTARQIPGSSALNQEGVRQLIQAWQATKAEALGPKRIVDRLPQVLTGPALREWSTRAQEARANNWYWDYKLDRLGVNALSSINPNQMSVEVTVDETANFFLQGQRQPGSSYTDTYQVRYTLVHQNSKWLIREMKVL